MLAHKGVEGGVDTALAGDKETQCEALHRKGIQLLDERIHNLLWAEDFWHQNPRRSVAARSA